MTETKMELTDWLDDLCVRFIINLPNEDLSSVARICFQVEEAQWYYEDFIRPLDPTLPSMSLRTFCMRIFQHCPLLSNFSATDHMGAFEEFLLYKTRVPVRGAILLNEAMDSVLLVKGWKKGANWSFPRGKINKDEDDLDCAVREVYEETGYDIKGAGLIPAEEQVKYIEMEMREQHMRLYVFRSIPEDTHFEPRTRKEISKIMWWKLSDLPAFRKKSKGHHHQEAGDHVATNANKFYMVAPFLRPLKTWVVEQKKKDARRTASGHYFASSLAVDDTLTEEEPTPQEDPSSYNEGRSSFQYFPTQEGASADADTMEKTTEALKRLLKIQPATQGVQSQMSSPLERSKSNKGADLLALLRGKPETLETSKSTVLPHTPLDLTFDTATVPKTPQHHPPPPPKLTSMPPPPSFPIPPTPIVYHDHPRHMSKQGMKAPDVPPHVPPHVQHPVHPQTYMQESRNHIQQLRHPQPLPPQVQKALFDGNLAHSPAVAQFQKQASVPSHSEPSSHAILNSQFPTIHGPMISEPKLNPAKLNQHSLALLNAFKSGEKQAAPTAPVISQDLPLRTYSQATIKPSGVQAPLAVPDNGRSALSPPSGNDFALPSILCARAPPTEAHKSSLLDIFKQPGPKANTKMTASSSSANIIGPSVSHKAPINHAHPPAESIPNPLKQQFSNGMTDNSATTSNRLPSSTTATSESRPIQPNLMNLSSRQRPHRQDGRQVSASHYNDSSITARNSQPSAPKVFQPQILKRPQQSPISQHSTLPIQPSQANSWSNVEAPKPTISSLFETRTPGFKTEQQQTLLSLFSKKPIDPLPLFGNPSISTLQPGQATDSRSKVSSTSGAPRRSSLTPMSPADQGFLLDYLEGVAKSHGR